MTENSLEFQHTFLKSVFKFWFNTLRMMCIDNYVPTHLENNSLSPLVTYESLHTAFRLNLDVLSQHNSNAVLRQYCLEHDVLETSALLESDPQATQDYHICEHVAVTPNSSSTCVGASLQNSLYSFEHETFVKLLAAVKFSWPVLLLGPRSSGKTKEDSSLILC